MSKVILLLGGNLGDTHSYFMRAKKAIQSQIGMITEASSIYTTEPWGFEHEQDFLNQAIIVDSKLNPYQILDQIQIIEKSLERKRSEENQYIARTIDIDILFYDDVIIHDQQLIIPHKLLHERKFALLPLAQICPDLIHPVLNKNTRRLLEESKDSSAVKLLQKVKPV